MAIGIARIEIAGGNDHVFRTLNVADARISCGYEKIVCTCVVRPKYLSSFIERVIIAHALRALIC